MKQLLRRGEKDRDVSVVLQQQEVLLKAKGTMEGGWPAWLHVLLRPRSAAGHRRLARLGACPVGNTAETGSPSLSTDWVRPPTAD